MVEEVKKEVKPANIRLQEFLKKEGLAIAVVPSFVPTNHNTFEFTVQVQVQEKPNVGNTSDKS